MGAKFEESEFVDADFQSDQREFRRPSPAAALPDPVSSAKPPSREDLDARMGEAQRQLAELKRAQDQLERERAQLEDSRRRRAEYQTGREEMLKHLTRGTQLLEEAEFAARRDADQMAKSLADLREALAKVQALSEEGWTTENWPTELTRALATLENARMEWNSARRKWPRLDGALAEAPGEITAAKAASADLFEGRSFMELCQLGLALSWPVALAALLGTAIVATLLLRQ